MTRTAKRLRPVWRVTGRNDKGRDVSAGGFQSAQEAVEWLREFVTLLTPSQAAILEVEGFLEVTTKHNGHYAMTMSSSLRETDN